MTDQSEVEKVAKELYEIEEKFLFGENGETWERALVDCYRKGQVIIFRKKATALAATLPKWGKIVKEKVNEPVNEPVR